MVVGEAIKISAEFQNVDWYTTEEAVIALSHALSSRRTAKVKTVPVYSYDGEKIGKWTVEYKDGGENG